MNERSEVRGRLDAEFAAQQLAVGPQAALPLHRVALGQVREQERALRALP